MKHSLIDVAFLGILTKIFFTLPLKHVLWPHSVYTQKAYSCSKLKTTVVSMNISGSHIPDNVVIVVVCSGGEFVGVTGSFFVWVAVIVVVVVFSVTLSVAAVVAPVVVAKFVIVVICAVWVVEVAVGDVVVGVVVVVDAVAVMVVEVVMKLVLAVVVVVVVVEVVLISTPMQQE